MAIKSLSSITITILTCKAPGKTILNETNCYNETLAKEALKLYKTELSNFLISKYDIKTYSISGHKNKILSIFHYW